MFIELTAYNAVTLLKQCEFRIFTNWSRVAGTLGVPLEDRKRLRQRGLLGDDYVDILEEAIQIWISSGQASWDKLLDAVEQVEKNTANKMRERLSSYNN